MSPHQPTDTAAPARCQRCDSELVIPVVCVYCHHVMPEPTGLTHFDRLGLPRRFNLDSDELERKYLAWTRELHPDYFSDQPPEEQKLSLTLSAGLNDAYRTIKDPFSRAQYLLALEGFDPDSASHRPAPEFLEEMLAVREQIAEIQAAADRSDAEVQAQRIEERLSSQRDDLLEQIAHGFARLESLPADDPGRAPLLERLHRHLVTARYVNGLLHEVTVNT